MRAFDLSDVGEAARPVSVSIEGNGRITSVRCRRVSPEHEWLATVITCPQGMTARGFPIATVLAELEWGELNPTVTPQEFGWLHSRFGSNGKRSALIVDGVALSATTTTMGSDATAWRCDHGAWSIVLLSRAELLNPRLEPVEPQAVQEATNSL